VDEKTNKTTFTDDDMVLNSLQRITESDVYLPVFDVNDFSQNSTNTI